MSFRFSKCCQSSANEITGKHSVDFQCNLVHEQTTLSPSSCSQIIGGPRAAAGHRKYSGIYWKNFTGDHSFKVASLVGIYCVIKQHYCLSHTLCMCALDARFLHSFSCCWQDGGSQIGGVCPVFSVGNIWRYINVNYYKLLFDSVLKLISV